jgi:hypothetical protein
MHTAKERGKSGLALWEDSMGFCRLSGTLSAVPTAPASCLAAAWPSPLCGAFGAILPDHGKRPVIVCDHVPQAAPMSADGRGCAIARRTPAVVTTPWGADIWPVKVA